jgi:hypothetical protein
MRQQQQQQLRMVRWNPLLAPLQGDSLAAALTPKRKARLLLQAAVLAFYQACHHRPHMKQQGLRQLLLLLLLLRMARLGCRHAAGKERVSSSSG